MTTGLAGAGGDREVEQSDKGVNDEQGDHRALALQQAGHGVDDGVGDVALGKQDGHRPAQADYHGGRTTPAMPLPNSEQASETLMRERTTATIATGM